VRELGALNAVRIKSKGRGPEGESTSFTFTTMKATLLFSVLLVVVSSAASFSGLASLARPTRSSTISKRKTELDLAGVSFVSSASANALLARGGEQVVLKSFYGDALGYFGGIRIPGKSNMDRRNEI